MFLRKKSCGGWDRQQSQARAGCRSSPKKAPSVRRELAVKQTEGEWNGDVRRFGLATPGAEDYRPLRLAMTPTISQATPDSFLPRWGKKPLGLAVVRGDRHPHKAPSSGGSWLPEGQTEGAWSMGGIPFRLGCRPRQKTTVPCALHLPLPSVRLRLTASSPAGGRSLLGWLLPQQTPSRTPQPRCFRRGRPRRAVGSRRRPSKRPGQGWGPCPIRARNCCPL